MPDPSQADTAEFSRGPVFNRVANYFSSQPFGNLLSFVVICGFGYWFWWSQTTGDDQKAKRLQEAFAQIHADNAKTLDSIASKHADAVKSVAEQAAGATKTVAEKNADTAKLMIEHAEAAGKRREKEGERTEQFLREFVRPLPASKTGARSRDGDSEHVAERPDVSPGLTQPCD